MKKRKYVIIHCTATPEGRNITGKDIRKMHLSPYPMGRGWKQVGYADLILLDGTVENLVKYNYDSFVDSWEITNGVANFNSISLHICYVGGVDKKLQPKNTLTALQEKSLKEQLFKYISYWDYILIAGHNQFAAKACPSFDTVQTLFKWGIPVKNIYNPKNLKFQ